MDGTLFDYIIQLSTVVGVDAVAAMLADNIATIPFAAFALFLVTLTAKSSKGSSGGFLRALLAGDWFSDESAVDRMFERRNISATKPCPGCNEQLALTVVICETCDHNFLTGTVGAGQRMLPSPTSRDDEMPARVYAFRA